MAGVPANNFADRLCAAVKEKKSILCAGLDPQLKYMPPQLIREAVERYGRTPDAIMWLFSEFNCRLIDTLYDVIVCIKPNIAFYEQYGPAGIRAYYNTVARARVRNLLVIGDVKRGDGGDTADAYADGHIGQVPWFGAGDDPTILTKLPFPMGVDCITVNGYIGEDCVGRFITRVKEFGTGIFVVDKTSFKPNSAVEQLIVKSVGSEQYVWQELAWMVSQWGDGTEGVCGLRNVGVVMGATYPKDAVWMRETLPDSIFLIPGFGAQNAGADAAVVGIRRDGLGGVVNTSRALTYAWCDKKGTHQCRPEDFAVAARIKAIEDRDALADACRKAGKWPF